VLYLLDANVLITAHGQYYPIDMVPEFWEWLLHMADSNAVKMPVETFEEVKEGHKDELHDWINAPGVEDRLVLPEDVDAVMVQTVLDKGYGPNLNEAELEQVGQDPFLIAYCLAGLGKGNNAAGRCVVSLENSKPGKLRANRKVPDVCKSVGVPCCHLFPMMRQLGFSTNWKSQGNAKVKPITTSPPAHP
jgi:hypothetical protein